MKKINLILFLFLAANLSAQNFKPTQSLQLPIEPKVIVQEHTKDFRFFLNSTEKEMCMADGIEGKILWTLNIAELSGAKKVVNQLWNKEANVILLFNEDSKKNGVAEKFFIDGKTGKLLWKSKEYLSEKGDFKLADNFSNAFDKSSGGVLLSTENSINLVKITNGEAIWSTPYAADAKAKNFDAYIMSNYDLVCIVTGKDTEYYLSTQKGEKVDNIDAFYNQKKAFENDKKSVVVTIPEKNMYVVMKAKTSVLGLISGFNNLNSWKMDFMAFDNTTNALIWKKQHLTAHHMDYISMEPFIKMIYLDNKIFIEHMPNVKVNSGLTVLDVNTGEKLWECYYTTFETKGSVNNEIQTPFPAPDPICSKGNIYVVDKIKNKLYCYSSTAGTLKWESDKFPDAQKIPTLIGYQDVVILGYGGPEKKISYTTQKSSGFSLSYRNNYMAVYNSGGNVLTYKYIYNDVDKFGLTVFEAETGKELWSNATVAKSLKDKFEYIAGTLLYQNKLFVATDKNFFILEPKTGKLISSVNIKNEKLGDIWKLIHFPEKSEVILNCSEGVIKVDLKEMKVMGSVKISNIQGPVVSELIHADNKYDDYAIFTDGNVKKMDYKTFASIDLENMKIRGIGEASVIYSDLDRFSEGGEYFFKNKAKLLEIFKVK